MPTYDYQHTHLTLRIHTLHTNTYTHEYLPRLLQQMQLSLDEVPLGGHNHAEANHPQIAQHEPDENEPEIVVALLCVCVCVCVLKSGYRE
jgi:hypothetical protein